MKIAILSNVNINSVIRQLNRTNNIYQADGYGNEIGILLNKKSNLYAYKPDIVFIIEDTVELINHLDNFANAVKLIDDWFNNFELSIEGDALYYVSNAYINGPEYNLGNLINFSSSIISYWNEKLDKLILKHANVRLLDIYREILSIGFDNSFSTTTWYMGRIPYSQILCNRISDLVLHKVYIEENTAKKVLLLDLDNTLWGGLAGENDIDPVELTDEHNGLIYKTLQRVIKQMKNSGVILGIVSKNNLDDAMHIINNNHHMVLREDDFVIKKINWNNKVDNIREVASELNLGLDSIVFFDDNDTERYLVKEALPEVIVPEFPKNINKLPDVMVDIWKKYFDKPMLTKEDLNKTEEYRANNERNELKHNTADFNDYLKKLDIVLKRVSPEHHTARIAQLLNKTNQFNLTTVRHSLNELLDMMADKNYDIFTYNVSDRFGDSGVVAVVIVKNSDHEVFIEDFVMSCRVMGRKIENAIIDDIEDYYRKKKVQIINSKYVKTDKNFPVSELFDSLNYSIVSNSGGEKKYKLDLSANCIRDYSLKKEVEV